RKQLPQTKQESHPDAGRRGGQPGSMKPPSAMRQHPFHHHCIRSAARLGPETSKEHEVKKLSVLALAMTATLALGACSTEDEPEEPTAVEQTSEDTGGDNAGATSDDMAAETGDAASGTGDAAGQTGDAASYSEPACQEFFTEGGPLADRAETARAALDAGEVTDSVAVSEVTTLKSRI